MAGKSNLFNPGFPPIVKAELDRRGKMPDSWQYKKYAYISLKLTGKSASNICVEDHGLVIGDANKSSMYTNEGGVRKPKIVLQSVNVVNQGGSDYTDAYLYEIDASFKVYNKNTMDRVERGFFRLGAEMQINFGWRGSSVSCNKGTILASIYNFGFTMEADGSYVCNVKAMSAAGLFGQETAGGDVTTESLGLGEETTGTETKFVNLMEAFALMARKALGMAKDDKSVKDLAGNTVRYKTYKNYNFAALELELPAAWYDFIGNDTTVLYTSLGSLIDYLNATSKKAGGLFWINYFGGSQSEMKLWPDGLSGIGSANPFRIFFPDGEASVYDKDGGTDGIRFNLGYLTNKKSENYFKSEIGKIWINVKVLADTYSNLQGNASGAKGVKSPPKTAEFLSKVFSIIEEDTGGIVRLQTRPEVADLNELNGVPSAGQRHNVVIINRAMIPARGITNPSPYTFKVLAQTSITRTVSLASDFDTDMLIQASQKSLKEGSSNMAGLKLLYSNCDALSADVVTPDAASLVTLAHITERKADIGINGWTPEKSSTLTSLIQRYLMQNAHTIQEGAYAEIPMMLKLGVTIDGITDVPYMAPIKIDRMPTIYNNPHVDFAIISIEHSFDGQGDWSTSYETVMRIR